MSNWARSNLVNKQNGKIENNEEKYLDLHKIENQRSPFWKST